MIVCLYITCSYRFHAGAIQYREGNEGQVYRHRYLYSIHSDIAIIASICVACLCTKASKLDSCILLELADFSFKSLKV